MDIKEYIRGQLNDEQTRAALHTDSSALILAGAGSGKTRVLTYKIWYLLFEKKIRPDQVLAVTFTNKAASEMKERLVKIAEEISEKSRESKAEVVMDFDAMISSEKWEGETTANSLPHYNISSFKWIGTFHGMFLRFLKEEMKNAEGLPRNGSFGVYDEQEAQSILKEIIKDLKMENDIEVREARSFISKLKWQGITAKQFGHGSDGYEQTMGMIYERYEKKFHECNMCDFDDLLLVPYLILKNNPEILKRWQQKFRYVLVDEAQDTNWIQFELMKQLTGGGANITFIGDDYQSIYRRRGAVMENFLQVKKIRPDIEIFKLQTNYRSRPHIVHAGNFIIKHNKNQYDKTVVPHRNGDEKIMVFTHGDETDEAMTLIDLMKKLKTDKNKSWADFAILYRTNAQSAIFEQVLLQEAIPYKVYGGFKFFERKEVKDVMSYLKYLLNPRDSVALKRIINTPKRKIGPDSVAKLEEYAQQNNSTFSDVAEQIDMLPVVLGPSTQKAISQFMTSMKFLRQSADGLTPAKLIEQLVKSIKYKDYLIEAEWREVGEEKYENIGQLINIASRYDSDEVEDAQNGMVLLTQFLEEVTLMTDIEENTDGQLEAVKLMSVHASKGLEFSVVFLVWLEENIFPLPKAAFDDAELEEERRLMYVAITRAKDHLFFSHANSRKQRWQTKYNEPSRFLEEIPEELKKMFDLTAASWSTGVRAGGSRFGGTTSRYAVTTDLNEHDLVKHKLFWLGEVIEVRRDTAVVKFQNEKFGVRKIEARFLEKK